MSRPITLFIMNKMQTNLIGLLLLLTASIFSGVSLQAQEPVASKRVIQVKGTDLQSRSFQTDIKYDENGRPVQLDFFKEIVYKENGISGTGTLLNPFSLISCDLLLKNGQPAVWVASYYCDSLRQSETMKVSLGNFRQDGDTLTLESMVYLEPGHELTGVCTTRWITDKTGRLKKRIRTEEGENTTHTSVVYHYDEKHPCMDIPTAYFVSRSQPEELFLLLNGQLSGMLRNMPSRLDFEGSPGKSLEVVNEYDKDGTCIGSLLKDGKKTVSEIRFEYETKQD